MNDRFTFTDGETRELVCPMALQCNDNGHRKVRVLLTSERVVLLECEYMRHFLAVLALAVIAIAVAVGILTLLHVQNSSLPMVLAVVFAIGANIHLQYRFRNPRLHRVIMAIPREKVTSVEEISANRVLIRYGDSESVQIFLPVRDSEKLRKLLK